MHDRELRIGKESFSPHDDETSFPNASRSCNLTSDSTAPFILDDRLPQFASPSVSLPASPASEADHELYHESYTTMRWSGYLQDIAPPMRIGRHAERLGEYRPGGSTGLTDTAKSNCGCPYFI